MPIQNAEIAAIFDQTAELLEIEGGNPFRARAYRRAARTIENLPRTWRIDQQTPGVALPRRSSGSPPRAMRLPFSSSRRPRF